MQASDTSVAEVTHISRHGFRVLIREEELLVPFADFPWFRNANVEQIWILRSCGDHCYLGHLEANAG